MNCKSCSLTKFKKDSGQSDALRIVGERRGEKGALSILGEEKKNYWDANWVSIEIHGWCISCMTNTQLLLLKMKMKKKKTTKKPTGHGVCVRSPEICRFFWISSAVCGSWAAQTRSGAVRGQCIPVLLLVLSSTEVNGMARNFFRMLSESFFCMVNVALSL